ncbi:MAG: hypothetical protein FWD64_13415, partial [Acidobacteriaceae bacterium]|nr:hypothetical protein [Acidobacteriaceae bacterium]
DAAGKERLPVSHIYGNIILMKTTLEIPDAIFRRAKSAAARRGIPLRVFVTEAVNDKLTAVSNEKPWMDTFGKLRHLRKETARINRIIEEEFEQIEPEDWL